jgi:hypothetical protein
VLDGAAPRVEHCEMRNTPAELNDEKAEAD